MSNICKQWEEEMRFSSNKKFIEQVEKNLNAKLEKEGKLTLGDIYDELGIERRPWGNYSVITHELEKKVSNNDGWIPVEERLPDENGVYLCTVEPYYEDEDNYVDQLYFRKDEYGHTWHMTYDSIDPDEDLFPEVIAWMPNFKYPEPYQK